MSTKMDNPVDAANATVDAMKQQTNPGDVASVVRDEIKTAHETFAGNPQDYRGYINTLKGSLSQNNQPEWLQDVQIFDDAATANDTINGKNAADGTPIKRADSVAQVKALTGSPDNQDELYKLLDNYSATKNSDTSDAARGDGKIGRGDLQAFIDDKSVQDSRAAQYLAKHPDAAPAIQQMYDRLGDAPGFIVRDELLNEMGYSGNDALKGFQNDNSEFGAVVTVGANGKPDSLVIPDGTARGFHYNESGNIDGINKTNPDGSTKQYRKDEQGSWVDENGNPAGFAKPSFDENGNYSYYTQAADDPNTLVQTSIDAKTGATSTAQVAAKDAAGNSVLAEPTDEAGATGKMGTLDVVAAQDGPQYTINSGDTLTGISRRILNMQPGQEDPAKLSHVVNALAAANNYDDPNLILAGAQMKVPTDILSAAQSPPEAEQQALTPEQQAALTPEQQAALTPEQQAMVSGQQGLTPEQQAMILGQPLTPEQQAMVPEQQTLIPEQQAMVPEQAPLPVSQDPSLTSPTAPVTEPMGPLPAAPAQQWPDLVAPPAIYGQSADSAPKV